MAACNMVAYRLEENGRKLEVSHFAVENPISLETSKKKIKVAVVLGQNLGQIRSNVVKKVKKQALSICFFHILHGEYLLKQKVVVVQVEI